jgi:hypothetical protein
MRQRTIRSCFVCSLAGRHVRRVFSCLENLETVSLLDLSNKVLIEGLVLDGGSYLRQQLDDLLVAGVQVQQCTDHGRSCLRIHALHVRLDESKLNNEHAEKQQNSNKCQRCDKRETAKLANSVFSCCCAHDF